ncbi:MAG: DinB family protein [Anaerolineae bacterium]|nr:DinB family protein [Anaerolineae bacterium]
MSKRDILLEALAATPSDLERLVKGLDSPVLVQRPTPDEWSIADVLCHLVTVEEQGLARLQLMVRQHSPTISPIYPDAAAHDLSQPVTTLLANFREARQAMLVFLRELKAGDWQVTAVHPTQGNLSVRFLVQHHVDHDTAHLNQIVEIRDRELVHSPISNLQSPP